MATHAIIVDEAVGPEDGMVFRTRHNESLMVLAVRKDHLFVEYADGRHATLSWQEWDRLSPSPAAC